MSNSTAHRPGIVTLAHCPRCAELARARDLAEREADWQELRAQVRDAEIVRLRRELVALLPGVTPWYVVALATVAALCDRLWARWWHVTLAAGVVLAALVGAALMGGR